MRHLRQSRRRSTSSGTICGGSSSVFAAGWAVSASCAPDLPRCVLGVSRILPWRLVQLGGTGGQVRMHVSQGLKVCWPMSASHRVWVSGGWNRCCFDGVCRPLYTPDPLTHMVSRISPFCDFLEKKGSYNPDVSHTGCLTQPLCLTCRGWCVGKHLCLTRRGRWCGNCTSVFYHTLRLTRGGCCVGTALVSNMPRLLCVLKRHSCLTRLGCCIRRLRLTPHIVSYTTHCVLHPAAVVWERHLCLTPRGGCVGKPLVSYTPRRLCGKLHKRQNDVIAN